MPYVIAWYWDILSFQEIFLVPIEKTSIMNFLLIFACVWILVINVTFLCFRHLNCNNYTLPGNFNIAEMGLKMFEYGPITFKLFIIY